MNSKPTLVFQEFKEKFSHYVASFRNLDAEGAAHFELKNKHTWCVVSNIRRIAKEEGYGPDVVKLAAIIGLFHDIGRFKQYHDYHTFDDAISVNHATMSIGVIKEQGLLKQFDHATAEIIMQSILQHNIPAITENTDPDIILFARLLRDADKIDILKLQTQKDIIFTLGHHKPVKQYAVPEKIRRCFLEERTVTLDLAESINDFRLLRLSWIYDMNFKSTFRMLHKKNYAAKILEKIPSSDALQELGNIIHRYIQRRMQE
jgi:hypothetical protein